MSSAPGHRIHLNLPRRSPGSAKAGWLSGSRTPRLCFLLGFFLCLAGLGGCDEGREDGRTGAVSGQGSAGTAGTASPSAAGGGTRVYPLSQPGPEPAPEEREHAEAVVEFANEAGAVVADGLCGRYPLLVMREVQAYRRGYAARHLAVEAPRAGCAAAGVPEPQETVLGSDAESLRADLKAMDGKRASMQAAYAALERYAADRSAIDEGKKGAELAASLEADYEAFARAREHFIAVVNAKAEEAQGVLLRAHPLKAQVLLARRLFEGFRNGADAVGSGEPDAKIMAGILDSIAADLDQAEHLPFPMAGETEMAYRCFLKSARAVLDAFRKGVSASYSQDVRKGINEAWTQCRAQYNVFVDKSSSVAVKRH